jgi:GT2 family glycosyltransferase
MTDTSKPLMMSIVIVNWNVEELLRGCLASIEADLQLPADQYEVLVVDNLSSDGSVAMVAEEFPSVRLIANQENVGFGRANNQTLSIVRGKYLLLLNPDTLLRDHALDKMLAIMEADPSIWALGCRLVNGDGSLQRWTGGSFPSVWTAACHYLFLNYLLPKALRPPSLYLDSDVASDVDVDWVSGAVLMLRRDKLDGKLFDERFFMYGEDMELCHRLKSAGGRIVYSPAATVVHFQGASMKQQSGVVMKSSLEGLRSFHRMSTGGRGLVWIDLLTVVGFGLRYIIYGTCALLFPKRGYQSKAQSSRHYCLLASRIMLGK